VEMEALNRKLLARDAGHLRSLAVFKIKYHKRTAVAESGSKRKHFSGLVVFEASLAQYQQKC